MKHAPSADERPAALFCRIGPADVEAMLDAYDSGMCDTSTANCLSQAVTRLLGGARVFPLIRYGESTAELDIHGHRVAIPSEVVAWLNSAETGSHSGPIKFALDLPPAVGLPAQKAGPRLSKRPGAFLESENREPAKAIA
jgi:hypothetical protein